MSLAPPSSWEISRPGRKKHRTRWSPAPSRRAGTQRPGSGFCPCSAAALRSTSCRVAARICVSVSWVIGSVIVKNWPGAASASVAGSCAVALCTTRRQIEQQNDQTRRNPRLGTCNTGANHSSRTPSESRTRLCSPCHAGKSGARATRFRWTSSQKPNTPTQPALESADRTSNSLTHLIISQVQGRVKHAPRATAARARARLPGRICQPEQLPRAVRLESAVVNSLSKGRDERLYWGVSAPAPAGRLAS